MTDIIRKTAMALGGGLIALGIVLLGLAEILAGKPYGALLEDAVADRAVAADPTAE